MPPGRTLLHVSNLYGSEQQPAPGRTLDRLLGGGGRVFFSNSGAEANEAAIKLARKFGGRSRHVVVSAYGSFTAGRSPRSATGQPAKHEAFQPLPEGFRHVTWMDLDDLERSLDDTVAAVLLEPVQGEGGVHPASGEYLRAVRELCDERGVLLMFDEVQTGLGRCGAWFAHQPHGVRPDVVTMAKALGNGVPIGACWATDEVAGVFDPATATTGGQPLAAAAGGAGGGGRDASRAGPGGRPAVPGEARGLDQVVGSGRRPAAAVGAADRLPEERHRDHRQRPARAGVVVNPVAG